MKNNHYSCRALYLYIAIEITVIVLSSLLFLLLIFNKILIERRASHEIMWAFSVFGPMLILLDLVDVFASFAASGTWASLDEKELRMKKDLMLCEGDVVAVREIKKYYKLRKNMKDISLLFSTFCSIEERFFHNRVYKR